MASKPKDNKTINPTGWKEGASYYDNEGKLYTEDEAKQFTGNIPQAKAKGVKRIDPAKTKEMDDMLKMVNEPPSPTSSMPKFDFKPTPKFESADKTKKVDLSTPEGRDSFYGGNGYLWEELDAEFNKQKPAAAATTPKGPSTWQERIKAGQGTDEDMETAYAEWKAGRYTPGPKTLAALEAMSDEKFEAQGSEDNDIAIMRRNFEQWAKENGEEPTDENFALWYQMGSGEPEYARGSEAGYDPLTEMKPSKEQVDEGQSISDEIQNSAFNEDGTPNADTIKSVGEAATKALGVKVNVEDGTLSVEDFKAPSMWSSADAWGKASIVLTALSALATALTFGRIPPINFMALSGVKEKWITEAQQALKNYNEVVTPQLKQASEAFGTNIGEGIRATQDEATARQAAKIEGIMSTAHEKAMTEVNKINWNNQAEANAYLEKAKAQLQASLKLVDRETQVQLLTLQQDYAQEMAELSMNLQMARDNNNNALQQKLVKQASDLQASLRAREAEALTNANIDQTKISEVVSGLNGISSAAQSAATVQSAVGVGTSIVDSIGGVVSDIVGSIF